MERTFGVHGVPRRPFEAPLEYLERLLGVVEASAHSVRRLTQLFERARFSEHEVDLQMRDEAIEALVALREELGDEAVVIADLCLDEYTDHGHCGVLNDLGEVDNDATLELYQRIAIAQAEGALDRVAALQELHGPVLRHAGLLLERLRQLGLLAKVAVEVAIGERPMPSWLGGPVTTLNTDDVAPAASSRRSCT